MLTTNAELCLCVCACVVVCEQAELKALQERLDIDKQHWEENYKKKEVCRHWEPAGVYADQ